MSQKKSFFKTIRFRLTLWYSILLLLISGSVILGINIIVTHYYSLNTKEPNLVNISPRNQLFNQKWHEITENQKDMIQEIRKQDLNSIRAFSLYSFIPLAFLSFFGGYIIADQMLRPLQKLNLTFTQLNAKNLDKEIEHEDSGDEISELIKNFNKMTSRLNNSFQLQKDFIANSSHELKSPLAIIQTNLEALLSNPKNSKKELSEYLRNAIDSVSFMNKLIEDLLLLSLLENHINKKLYSFELLIQKVFDQAQIIAKKKEIIIDYKIDSKYKDKKVNINPELIQRAIMNLIENAVKYSKKKSHISIKLSSENHNIIVSIKDEGIGIPDNEKERVFDRFYRVDKSRSRKTGGTGLGLAITRQILELHKGEISLKSKVGKGTTVTIQIPYKSN